MNENKSTKSLKSRNDVFQSETGKVQIVEVVNKRLFKQFIELPWKIYQNNPYWVPPLKYEIRNIFNPHNHPFYRHGWVKKFIALKNNEVVGRILVADDPRFNEENNTKIGNFGFFECINDQTVANALLDQAALELKNRGLEKIFGPVEYSTNYSCGLLIEGFDLPAKTMMPFNPPYYAELFSHWGLEKNRDLCSWWFDDSLDIISRWKKSVEKLNKRYQINIRPFRMNHFSEDVQNCMKVYDHARKNWWWACVSLTKAEIKYYAHLLKMIVYPELVLLAEIDGQTIGFSITIPDINEAIAPLNGRLSWFGIPYLGLLRLLWRFKRIKSARVMVLCVLPEYQHRGIAERLILETLDYGKNVIHFTEAELGWTDEANEKINQIIKRVGAKMVKKYRVYEKNL
ncbi:MAG: GNAT family N-acetyltransferase [Planctomycetia bacterium]|nr:GNAT family N-acetyltransferase [Planctomycetia bacterium]